MRKIAIAAMVAASLALGGSALADHGPAGSHEGGPEDDDFNQVTCTSQAPSEAPFKIDGDDPSDGAGALVICFDNEDSEFNGRVILSGDANNQSGYVAVDGDASNGAPLDGYVRVDSSGPHCGNASNQDASSEDQSQNTCVLPVPEETPEPPAVEPPALPEDPTA